MLNQRDEMRLKRAVAESPQHKRMEELRAKVAETQLAAERAKRQEQIMFARWEEADRNVRELERIRDDNMPKFHDGEWNEKFCLAIQLLPDSIERAENLWYQYTQIKL